MSRLREENRKLRSDYDELQLQYDDEVYNGGAWKKERERLETKIADVTNAYESSTAARARSKHGRYQHRGQFCQSLTRLSNALASLPLYL